LAYDRNTLQTQKAGELKLAYSPVLRWKTVIEANRNEKPLRLTDEEYVGIEMVAEPHHGNRPPLPLASFKHRMELVSVCTFTPEALRF
jgi:hypothetical protein